MTQPTTADLYYLVRGGTLLIRPVSLEAVEFFDRNFKQMKLQSGFYALTKCLYPKLRIGIIQFRSRNITFTAKKIQE
ncbi:MAG TPA: hypothetical protein VGK47_03740 [Nitrososphaeraceae archaeon]